MTSLDDVIAELKEKGILPEDVTIPSLTPEQWGLISKRMQELQEISSEKGEGIGIIKGKTPKQQAKEDRENPNLCDPLRDSKEGLRDDSSRDSSSSENKG